MQQKLKLATIASAFGLLLFLAPTAAHAADVPSYDELYQQAQTDAQTKVQSSLNGGSSNTTSTTPSSSADVPTDANVIILNTGNNAAIDTSVDQSSTTSVTNNNQATVNQEVNAAANTGNNTADRNISYGGNAGMIATGDAAINSGLSASVNHNATAISNSCPDLNHQVTVYNTGNNVQQNDSASNTCVTTVTNNNNATINQVVNGSANTGGNSAERNISFGGSAGQVTTGNATVGSLLATQGNQNVVIIGGHSSNGGPGSGANIYILNTGDNAVLVDRRRYATTTSVTNTNSLTSDQTVNAAADTGNNTASRNINQNGDAGVIVTGDAVVNSGLAIDANRNDTAIVGSGGNTTSNVHIVNTGDSFNGDSQSSVNNTTTVTNNNQANINQVVNATANTGTNHADRNISVGGDAGVIQTGDAIVNTALDVSANRNNTLISGATGTAQTNLDVTNTGNDVAINGGSTSNNTVNVTSNNQANVNQVVNVSANTGNNEANQNIGGSSITTGGVNITSLGIANVNGNMTLIVNADAPVGGAFWDLFSHMFGTDLHGATVTLTGNVPQNFVGGTLTNTGNNVVVDLSHADVTNISVNNHNVASVNQVATTNANTGNNICSQNIGDCSIMTGDVAVTTVLLANVNGNMTVIGNISFPQTPETPVTPVTPTTPETGVESESVTATTASVPQSEVLGESVTAPAGATLPETGTNGFALIGGLLVLAGLTLRRKAATH